MLSEADREKIRAEEIFRQEVRESLLAKSSKGSGIPPLLNSPFVLFVLSTIVVGGISFLYTKWNEAKDRRIQSEALLRDLSEEASFRVNQMDLLLRDALEKGEKCRTSMQSTGSIFGQDIADFLLSSQSLTVAVRLGGISQFPSATSDDPSRTVWIASAGFGNQSLPYKRGYKSQAFMNDDLVDICIRSSSLRDHAANEGEAVDFRNAMGGLRESTEYRPVEVVKDWFAREQEGGVYAGRYGGAYKIRQLQVADYGPAVDEVYAWVGNVQQVWGGLEARPLLYKALLESHGRVVAAKPAGKPTARVPQAAKPAGKPTAGAQQAAKPKRPQSGERNQRVAKSRHTG